MEPVATDVAADVELGGVVLLLADAVQLVPLDPGHRVVAVVGGAASQTISTSPSAAPFLSSWAHLLLARHLQYLGHRVDSFELTPMHKFDLVTSSDHRQRHRQ